MDKLTPVQRSHIMSRIRGKNTNPELIVRRIVHRLGYRYRLHGKDLPGKPDLVFRGRRKLIFVHGCWWHRHNCALGRRTPKSRIEYWIPKLDGNKKRDIATRKTLQRMGWKVLVIWECQTRDGSRIKEAICGFLEE